MDLEEEELISREKEKKKKNFNSSGVACEARNYYFIFVEQSL